MLEFEDKVVDDLLKDFERNKLREAHFNYTFKFIFEENFHNSIEFRSELGWILYKWYISVFYSIVYIGLVYIGKCLMKNREKVHLHRSLIAWNILLAGFSILGASRILPNFVALLYHRGLDYSICEYELDYGVVGFWTTAFAMSKLIDLFDTAFVVLRKQKLLFLHWYHHAITLVFAWYLLRSFTSIGRWFVAMNFSVHSFMYTYYAFKAARFSVPKRISIFITFLQLSQMFLGVFLNVYALIKKLVGRKCDVETETLAFAFFIYISFFILFLNYFKRSYLRKKQPKKQISPLSALTCGFNKEN